MTDHTTATMNDAIEHAHWQNLADALNQLIEWGADPLLGLADRLSIGETHILDPGEPHHTYRLRYRPPFGDERPDGRGDAWVVERRPEAGAGQAVTR
ncbi:hypothetical protein [Streptomyces sp. WAC05858]|uniref:hypothetical protein n=1 Tax=Streptomyces TaxID=1883 RepID=UPI000F7B466E|nr:hypothetical protein [Streptomyces sp. WAC05858]RSS37943.1 hypothetical protein EF902_31580 [Streptomyces sp. WAC05858]